MRNCRACGQAMPENARFCPHCGASAIEETLVCPSCGEENDLNAVSCKLCHFVFGQKKKAPPDRSQEAPKPPPDDIFKNDPSEKLEQEVAERFSQAFQKRLEEEHHPALHEAYIERFYESDFKTSADYRIQQLAEELRQTAERSPAAAKSETQKRALLEPAFEELLDYFLIRYCPDLNEALLPEAILKHQGLPVEKINLHQLVTDYLDFDREPETVWFNFVTMPPAKLKNAAQSFLFPKKGETIFFICDLSVLGNCKEGFAMTSECVYWKALLEKPQRVYYKNLEDVRRQEDWITVNGIFFNANKSLNLKLLRLLKRLRQLFGKRQKGG